MKRILNISALAAALIGFGALAYAQYGAPGGPYQPDSVNALADKVQTDLNQGYERWHRSHGDRQRLNQAEKRLRGFAGDWRNGKFDKGALDESIHTFQHVLDNNHLAGPERDALSSDVEQLRQMREAYDRHEIGRW